MVAKVFVIALFVLIFVQPSFQAATWDWLADFDNNGDGEEVYATIILFD